MTRLPEADGELIQRAKVISFSFDGKPVEAHEGDTIASALFAAGRRVFSRSFKYHRPRGLLCCSGRCPNCLVQVGDQPAVRACMTPVSEGLKVEHVNAWPSLSVDALSLGDRFGGRFMQVGFYYKTFIRPRSLWPLYEKVLRRAAGLGRIAESDRRTGRFDKVHRHVDVLVVGGGRAGLEAAAAAAREGNDTMLVDEGLSLGGRLAHGGPRERRAGAGAGGRRAGGWGRDRAARRRGRPLRGRARAGLRGQRHAARARCRGGAGHRADRAAAGVLGQRPARRDAGRGRPPPPAPVPAGARPPRRGGGRGRRLAGHRGRADGGGHRGAGNGGPAQGRQGPSRQRAARRARGHDRAGRPAEPAPVRPRDRLGRPRGGHRPAATGGRHRALRRGPRRVRARPAAGRRAARRQRVRGRQRACPARPRVRAASSSSASART